MTKKPSMRDIMMNAPPASLSEDDLVTAFAVVTRASNALDRRKRALRAEIDKKFAPLLDKGNNAFFDTGSVHVEAANKTFGQEELSLDKARALLVAKGIPEWRVMEQPPPVFSATAFEELTQSGDITRKEYKSCLVPARPAITVSVHVVPAMDEAIAKALLGDIPKQIKK